MDKELFDDDPRGYAMDLIRDGLVSGEAIASMMLNWLSCDDVRAALDANELSPRFDEVAE